MKYILRVKSIIDGEADAPLDYHEVAVENGRFLWIRPTGSAEGCPDTPVIDARDLIMLPGLIDAHVHLNNNSEPERAMFHLTDRPGDAAFRFLRNGHSTLKMGFTTVRDCAGVEALALRDAANRGDLVAPRIVACGYGISMTGGHMDWDKYPGARLGYNPGVADSPDQARRVARDLLKLGVDFIKVNATRGFGGRIRGNQEMSYEEMKAVVEVAHRVGLRVAAHAMGTDGIRAAVDAGVDSIEHGFWLTREIADKMAEQGTFMVPTAATLFRNVTRGFGPNISEQQRAHMHYLASTAREALMSSIKIAREAGVQVACGSDMGGGPFLYHGENATEIEQLVEAGFSNMDAIKAATAVSADLLDRKSDLGKVKPGFLADFVLLRADPLLDISILSKKESFAAVFLGGRALGVDRQTKPLLADCFGEDSGPVWLLK